MPRRKKRATRAPAQEVYGEKIHSVNPTISEKIMEAFYSGKSIPMIDKETYLKSCPEPTQLPSSSKKQKEPNTPRTAKESSASKENFDPKPLPVPQFTINESYTLSDMPYKPMHYIRYIEPTKEELDARVDYIMDEEDIAWLEGENETRVNNGAPPVSMDDFEVIMDRFEKESHFEIKKSSSESDSLDIQDDEAICCICMDGESQTYNEILFCEMCNLAVHQECYGIPYIPEGQWLCRRCFNSPSAAVDCILCPSNTGALKMTEGGYWSHILCAIWVPEVQFANPVFLEPVECVGKIPPSRWKLTCQLCKLKGVGACIQCTQKKCNIAFHPTCAQQAGYYMKFEGRPGEPKTKFNHSVFCKIHRPAIKRSENDKFEYFRQKMLKSVKTPITFLPVLPPERVQGIGDRVNFKNKNNFVSRMLSYWSLKRKQRYGVPLLQTRVYELNKKLTEVSQLCDEKLAEKNYKTCLRFRQDMEKVRLLLELVRKREKLKFELTKIKEQCMELQLMPAIPYMRKIVKILSSFDVENIFEKPVEVTDAPNYNDIIKTPMDFSTILKKVNQYDYDGIEDLEKDFNLMIENCLRYNKKNSFYHQAGIELRNKSRHVFKMAKDDFKNLKPLNLEDVNIPSLLSVKNEPSDNGSEPELSTIKEEKREPHKRKKSLKKNRTTAQKMSKNNEKKRSNNKALNEAHNLSIKIESDDSSSSDSSPEHDSLAPSKRLREPKASTIRKGYAL